MLSLRLPLTGLALSLLLGGLAFSRPAGAEEASVYPLVTEPATLLQAFTAEPDSRAVQTQAAFLLVLANLLHGATREDCIEQPHQDMAPPEDLTALGIPLTIYRLEKDWPKRYALSELLAELGRRGFASAGWRSSRSDPRLATELRVLAAELLARPERRAAALLVVHSLQHPDPLVRVAAATAAAEVVKEGRHLASERLRSSAREGDPLVRLLAATCLARLAPRDPLLEQLAAAGSGPPGREPIHSTTIVHGTWAAGGDWWRPQGGFHHYLLSNAAPDLYAGPDPFGWSGSWSDSARRKGAQQLAAWATAHQASCLNLFTHSHGGNLAMLATQRGLMIGRLILLSCPVHWAKYQPKPGSVGNALSIRTHLDLVILGDAGGQRFPKDSGIREQVLGLWFSHTASHDPEVWKARHLLPELPEQSCPHGPLTSWSRCAAEGQVCAFSGTRQVRYGTRGIYRRLTITNSTPCNNTVFGDPVPGFKKWCDFQNEGR
jgi:hypothetical protein